MKVANFTILLVLMVHFCNAQYQSNYNKVWAFGYKAGLDFSTGTPVPITTGYNPSVMTEGCSSVCDSYGNLLFYSNGTEVYNRNHTTMTSSPAVTSFSTFSTTQASLIVPVIDSPGRYYLFSLQQGTVGDPAMCKLVYCKIDMSLAGGYGDIVPFTKETFIVDSLGERMIAITGNNNNVWLLTHVKDSAIFLAYEITSTGINFTPVLSPSGRLMSPLGYAVGVLKSSPNRRKIVSNSVAQSVFGNKFGTEIFDFDPATGTVSNCIVLDSLRSHYGAEFSPDNTKLYTDERKTTDTMLVYQYDVSLIGASAIRSSKTQVATIARINASDFKLGPDGKIYFSSDTFSTSPTYGTYMSCISEPNLAAPGCGFTPRAVKLSPGTGMHLGLPNVYITQDTNFVAPVIVKNDQNVADFSIFPNPATNMLSIVSPETICEIKILNSIGDRIIRQVPNTKQIQLDVSSLLPGVYNILVNNCIGKRFIKM